MCAAKKQNVVPSAVNIVIIVNIFPKVDCQLPERLCGMGERGYGAGVSRRDGDVCDDDFRKQHTQRRMTVLKYRLNLL